jgi:CRP-like cAMP-binding protein
MTIQLGKYYLRNDLLFHALPTHSRKLLESGMEQRKIRKGRVLYREGSFPKGIYILRKGKLKVFQSSRDGREQILHIYTRDEIMGYRPVLCAETHPVSASALEDCTYWFIPHEYFLNVVEQSPEMLRLLLTSLSHEFSVWVNKISVFTQQPVRNRVALALLVLNKQYQEQDRPAEINLSRDDFASYVGTVKETLVRVLQEFKKNGIVETKGRKIRLLKPERLEEIVNA